MLLARLDGSCCDLAQAAATAAAVETAATAVVAEGAATTAAGASLRLGFISNVI